MVYMCACRDQNGHVIIIMNLYLSAGLLDAVSDVNVEFVTPSFIISWVAPFTFDPPGSPDITYCISITNVSSGSSLANECQLIPTSYSAVLELSVCVEYSATITPVNEVGNGTSITTNFPDLGTIVIIVKGDQFKLYI